MSGQIDVPRMAYSIAEVEVLCGLSRSTLYRLMRARKLCVAKRGRRVLISRKEVEKLCGLKE